MDHIPATEKSRTQILYFLPAAIEKALKSYWGFMEEEREIDDSKKFGEHQKAGKIAISHVELLFKLAAQIAPPGEVENGEVLGQLMQKAKESADDYKSRHPDMDDKDLA